MDRKEVLDKLKGRVILSVEAADWNAHNRMLETPYGDVMIRLDDGTILVVEGEPLTVIMPRGCKTTGVCDECGFAPTVRYGQCYCPCHA